LRSFALLDTIKHFSLVVQWIVHGFPVPKIQVRFLARLLTDRNSGFIVSISLYNLNIENDKWIHPHEDVSI
jgi:hypothetical protein